MATQWLQARLAFLRRPGWLEVYYVLLLTFSLALNVVLGFRLKVAFHQLNSPTRPGVREGRILSPVEVLTLNGAADKLSFTGTRPSVLHVFSPTCPYCEDDCYNITALARQRTGYRFVGLSTHRHNLASFLARCRLPFPVFVATSSFIADPWDLAVTPQTVVVGKDTRVQKVWVGMLVGKRRTEAERFFRTKIAQD